VIDNFAAKFPRERRPARQLYLIAPLDVTSADRLRRALDAVPVAT
jgi:hypothetical protein